MDATSVIRRWWWVGLAGAGPALAAAACSGGSAAVPTMEGTNDGGASAPSSVPTYYADVKPILDAKCTLCHTPGGIAPFTLLSYADAKMHAPDIAPAVKAHVMPPWPPSNTCNQYNGDRSLPQAEIDTIAAWAAGGAPEGDPSSYKPLGGPPAPTLSRIDQTLTMPSAYTPTQRPDDYRCFLLPWTPATTKYITGFGAKPGQTSIVHHLLVYQVPPDQIATYQAYDDADPGLGYTCFGGPTGSLNANGTSNGSGAPADAGASSALVLPQQIGGWVPGNLGSDFAAGTGIKILPGSMVVLQVHYNTLNSPPVPDQTEVDFELADSVDKEAFVLPFTDATWVKSHTMDIPAGDPDASHSYGVGAGLWASFLTHGAVGGSQPFTIYSSLLHMHLHGTETTLTLDHGDGTSTCLLDIPHWNFHWQGNYALAQPITVNPSDQIQIDCHWDNSAANQPVIDGQPMAVTDLNWGEGTTDEMCIGFVYVTK